MRAKARKSTSLETRAEAHRFAAAEARNLERIGEQLRKKTFKFAPSKAVLLSKPGKKGKRPVVIAPISSRIVQRALLNIAQAQPQISATLTAGFNFGGVEGPNFGVPAAVRKAQRVALEKPYYIRTDIKSFFVKVPRDAALKKIFDVIADESLQGSFKDATDTELEDCAKFGEDVKLFPIDEEGVAQGSCLSPLLCNLLLSDFDRLMNDRSIVCIRYIDDFILFANDKKSASKALASGRKHLDSLGLDVYDPDSNDPEERRKADQGLVRHGFDFLGCTVQGELTRPTTKNRTRLRDNVKCIFDEALNAMSDPAKAAASRNTYADAIHAASLIIRGWGNTHAFCTDRAMMKSEDGNLNKLFAEFNRHVKLRLRRLSDLDKRRALGLFALQDCNVDIENHHAM